ncbi:MAG: SDR family oxidoreductase [bacterium]|nr:SDR family oxidoreductase [bacterium]
MRALITGASGFIGGRLFLDAPTDIETWGTYLDNNVRENSSRTLRVDLRDLNAVNAILKGIKPDLLIHCAGYSSVAFCENAPTAAWEMNSWFTGQLAELCVEYGIRLIFFSSDMVFDGSKGNYSETDLPQPVNFYGCTKLAAERRVQETCSDLVVIRLNLSYGKPAIGGTSFTEEVIQRVQGGKPYFLFADQFRNFMSVTNLSQCVWELAQSDWKGLLHLGGSEPTDRVTFAHKLAEHLHLDSTLLIPSQTDIASTQVSYPKNNTFDLSLAGKILKTTLLNIDQGLVLEYPA